jgi:phosphatidylinositol alpha-1,6-mannosyltransferase
VQPLADRVTELLSDPAGAAAMGEKGRSWIDREWTWDGVAETLRRILA